MRRMAAKRTVHVFRSDGAWAVKKEGGAAANFSTQREAVTAARQSFRTAAGQLVVHGTDGRIRGHETFGMTPIQDPPRRSRLAKQISRAVGRVALRRIQSDH